MVCDLIVPMKCIRERASSKTRWWSGSRVISEASEDGGLPKRTVKNCLFIKKQHAARTEASLTRICVSEARNRNAINHALLCTIFQDSYLGFCASLGNGARRIRKSLGVLVFLGLPIPSHSIPLKPHRLIMSLKTMTSLSALLLLHGVEAVSMIHYNIHQ
jgi:hypothetical protein